MGRLHIKFVMVYVLHLTYIIDGKINVTVTVPHCCNFGPAIASIAMAGTSFGN